MFLRTLTYTSPASRSMSRLHHDWWEQKACSRLTLTKKNNAGRGSKGRVIIRTKGSTLIKRKIININYNYRYSPIGLITTFQLIPFKNLLVSLVLYSNGGLSYITKGFSHKNFKYLVFARNQWERRFTKHAFISWFIFFKKLSIVSLFEIVPGSGAIYCRSSGTFAKLKSFDFNRRVAVVRLLKTKVVKLASFYSIAVFGAVDLKKKKNYKNVKSGYWRKFGVKPLVRGVARNPIDHPHGGRTKSIKYPRTPWGKTTKFK